MGWKGGVSAFSAEELNMLNGIFDKHPQLTEHKLILAFERAEVKNVSHVAHELQKLNNE